MIKKPFHIIFLIIVITLLISCSTRKDRFLNRAVHTTTTKFNVLYNGTVAFDNAKKQLDESYEDNFFAILPIEPLKIKEKINTPFVRKKETIDAKKKNSKALGQAVNAVKSLTTEKKVSSAKGFLRAEEKAVKSVQKHSMNFSGKEKNKHIDDAYLLLGKARYYDQRFVPALETFTYITKHYSKSPLLNEAIIWEARCLNRLGNEDDAIRNLTNLLRKKTTSQLKSKAYTTLAMAYTSYDSVNRIISSLAESLKHEFENPNQKARNLFILGQLYRQENKIDSSNSTFHQLATYKKAPYRFKIHALLEKAKNYNKDTDNTEELVSMLKKLSKNRDNRPFLDEIHYVSGKIDLANNKTEEAILKFKESLDAKIKHPEIQSLVFEELGNYHFDNAAFIEAGEFYDKLLNINVNKPTKRIRSIARKRKSLDEIIRLEKLSTKNDSILSVVSMTKEAQIAFFTKHIKALEKQEKDAKDLAASNTSNSSGNGLSNSLLNTNKKTKGGKFYFYNAQTVGFGKAAFKNIWGDRALVDNWRLSKQKEVSEVIDNKETNTKEIIDEKSEKLDVDFYIKQIPTKTVAIDSIASERNDAYYQLGVIYKEKFKKDVLATLKLEKLLEFSPNKELVPPTYYNLFKAFASFNATKSAYYKAKILSDFPDSKYAKIITDPTFIVEDDKNVMIANYEKTYRKYVKENYDTTLNDCENYSILYAGSEIIPKFELLKAFAFSKKNKDKKSFIKALEEIIKNYPKTAESSKAQTIIDSLNGKSKAVKKTKNTKIKSKLEDKKAPKKNSNKRAMNMGPPSIKSSAKGINQVKNKNTIQKQP